MLKRKFRRVTESKTFDKLSNVSPKDSNDDGHYSLHATIKNRKIFRKAAREEKKKRNIDYQIFAAKKKEVSMKQDDVKTNRTLAKTVPNVNTKKIKYAAEPKPWAEDEKIINKLGKKLGKQKWNDGFDDLLDGICENFDDGLKNAAFEETSSVNNSLQESESSQTNETTGQDQFDNCSSKSRGDLSENSNLTELNSEVSIVTRHSTAPSDSKTGNNEYVPLELRSHVLNADCKLLRGRINRLTETNLTSIFEEIEKLFLKNSRREVYCWLCDYFLDDCMYSKTGVNTFLYAPTYAALIVLINLLVGMDFGGFFIEKAAKCLDRSTLENQISVSRNLLLIFISLFNFDLIHCSFFYDITRLLIERMNSTNIDLLILVLQRSGSKLRSCDPNSLKDILTLINKKSAEWSKNSEDDEVYGPYNKRVQVILDIMNNLKNNKMSQDYSFTETRLSDSLKLYLKTRLKNVPQVVPLNISWVDLTSNGKGRWWLLGSKHQIPSDQVESVKAIDSKQLHKRTEENLDQEILSLSKAQKMNTNLRKAIFGILVTSENYLDAFEKLFQLDIEKKFEQEISNVIIHCLEQENAFNPYYLFLTQKLCSIEGSKYKMLFKITLWNKLKEINSLSVRQISHDAQMFGYLIGNNVFSFSIIKKNIDYFCENPPSILFFKILLLTIFVNFDQGRIEKVFRSIEMLDDIMKFVKILRIFFQVHMKKINPKIIGQLVIQNESNNTYSQDMLTTKIQKMIQVSLDVLSELKDEKTFF